MLVERGAELKAVGAVLHGTLGVGQGIDGDFDDDGAGHGTLWAHAPARPTRAGKDWSGAVRFHPMTDAPPPLLKPVLIFLGAGAGGVLRYWLGGWVQGVAGPGFPVGTLVVNVTGCLAIGFLTTLFTGAGLVREEFRAAIIIGILGGYTTFSSFGRETMSLVANGQWTCAGLNVLLSNVLGLGAVWVGIALATRLYGAGAP